MKFYVGRAIYRNGDISHPWTLFADNLHGATQKFMAGFDVDEVTEVTLSERPESEISFYRNEDDAPSLVLEHPGVEWRRE